MDIVCETCLNYFAKKKTCCRKFLVKIRGGKCHWVAPREKFVPEYDCYVQVARDRIKKQNKRFGRWYRRLITKRCKKEKIKRQGDIVRLLAESIMRRSYYKAPRGYLNKHFFRYTVRYYHLSDRFY